MDTAFVQKMFPFLQKFPTSASLGRRIVALFHPSRKYYNVYVRRIGSEEEGEGEVRTSIVMEGKESGFLYSNKKSLWDQIYVAFWQRYRRRLELSCRRPPRVWDGFSLIAVKIP
ncbi:hypothetical protein TNIN_182071 [Trichonephila inaurata madagascariensis]|uniref:Uncharacterized protein n=1 Tax=Trichonephila inaurata madagascariensis TaxID=2747483 RepID=A0A8X7CLZ8_9ARAC|nr:hypothetical protein TNIN_182071 [Trichonephila inaurata madagascariensis]